MPDIEYFELQDAIIREPKEGEFVIATAAILSCGLCSTVIDGMGGPGYGAVCKRCGDELRKGKLRGAVIWEDA